jgi:hypothetical protein
MSASSPRAASPRRVNYHDETLDLRTQLHVEVCRTQQLYAKIISRPRLSAEQLRNPSISLIKSIFLELGRVTGCGQGLYTDEELACVGLKKMKREVKPMDRPRPVCDDKPLLLYKGTDEEKRVVLYRDEEKAVQDKLRFLRKLIVFVYAAVGDADHADKLNVNEVMYDAVGKNKLLQKLHLASSDDMVPNWKDALDIALQATRMFDRGPKLDDELLWCRSNSCVRLFVHRVTGHTDRCRIKKSTGLNIFMRSDMNYTCYGRHLTRVETGEDLGDDLHYDIHEHHP